VKDRYAVGDHSEGLGHILLIFLVLFPIGKEFSMHLAKVVGLGNAGGSSEPQY